jgi:hypothetical protein
MILFIIKVLLSVSIAVGWWKLSYDNSILKKRLKEANAQIDPYRGFYLMCTDGVDRGRIRLISSTVGWAVLDVSYGSNPFENTFKICRPNT